jgi:hypothetical protein
VLPLPELMTAPGVGRFLDAVDERLNSNTFLLAHRVPRPASGVAGALAQLLASPVFGETLRWADRDRGWDNWADAPGRFVRSGASLGLTRLDGPMLMQRLEWMLAVGGDWYGTATRRSPEEARALGAGLLGALGADAGWEWTQARPDFLHSHGYFDYTGESEDGDGALAYFDGGGCDGAIAGLGGDVLVLLLTNGSP